MNKNAPTVDWNYMNKEQIGEATLYCGDCLDILPSLGKVDCVVTDPPYGVYLGDTDNGQARDKQQQPYTMFIDSPEYVVSVAVKAVEQSIKLFSRVVITPGLRNAFKYPEPDDIGAWYIPAATSRSKWGFATSQPILYYGKSPRAGIGDTSTGVSITEKASEKRHPCSKPMRFSEWLVNKSSLPNHIVLDPFMGSGTTGVACANLGRKFIGIEIEPKYFDIACERITAAYAQGRLFA